MITVEESFDNIFLIKLIKKALKYENKNGSF